MSKLEMTSFRMKKRSSEAASWVAWSAILAIAIVAALVLSITQIVAMSPENVRFVNVRVPTVEDFRENKSEQDVVLSESSPMIYIGKSHVSIGSVKGLLTPRPGGDLVLIRKEDNWLSSFGETVLQWKRVKEVFPSAVVAIAYEESIAISEQVAQVQVILGELSKVNKSLGSSDALPAPVFVGFSAQKIASSKQGYRP